MIREKDFLKRAIEQLAQALARVAGLRREGRPDEALRELDGASHDAFGLPRSVLDTLDAASAVRLVGDASRAELYARVLEEESSLRRAAGLADDGRAGRAAALRAVLASGVAPVSAC